MEAMAGVQSSAQPVTGVWDMFSQFANLYVQDRQAERANVAAFNQYSYDKLANANTNLTSTYGGVSSTPVPSAQDVAGFVVGTQTIVIVVALAAAVYFAVK